MLVMVVMCGGGAVKASWDVTLPLPRPKITLCWCRAALHETMWLSHTAGQDGKGMGRASRIGRLARIRVFYSFPPVERSIFNSLGMTGIILKYRPLRSRIEETFFT